MLGAGFMDHGVFSSLVRREALNAGCKIWPQKLETPLYRV